MLVKSKTTMILNQERRQRYNNSYEAQQYGEYYDENDEMLKEQMLNQMNEDNDDEFFKHRTNHLLMIGISAFVGGLIVMRYHNKLDNLPIFRAIV